MTKPHQKLADSLDVLKRLQDGGRRVFQSKEFSRVHRERLLKNGFLQDVMKGWLMSATPSERSGDTTAWYASFWEFCAYYCEERFGQAWHLSPDQSLLIQAGHTVIPNQLIIYSSKGTNNTVQLPFGTSLYDLKQAEMPPKGDLFEKDGLRIYVASAALLKVSERFYQRHPVEAQVILAGVSDASDMLRRLLSGGHSTIAGRLAGAFRRIGKSDLANEIVETLGAADFNVRENDPFEAEHHFGMVFSTPSPIVARLQVFWETHRGQVIERFPPAPGLPTDKAAYLGDIDDVYTSDAYHSLSIEGYRVSPELIQRVRSGDWNPKDVEDDRLARDALAARGYWQAFQAVKTDVEKVISGVSAGQIASTAHRNWYRELFQPCVAAGIIGAETLAGYRNDAVFIQASRHIPPRWQLVLDAMPTLFELLAKEPEASVRAVLGHWLFGYIHPFPDGNGRVARFLMNLMLASGGYPWTVIGVDDRNRYMQGLESASVDADIGPFATFLSELVRANLEGKSAPALPADGSR